MANPEAIAARKKAYYEANKEHLLAKQKENYALNRTARRRQQGEYRLRKADDLHVYNKSDEGRARHRKYDSAHRDERAAAARARRASDPAKSYAIVRGYLLGNPHQKRSFDAKRRARKAGAAGSHTAAQWADLKLQYGHRCGYCGTEAKLTRDHDVPLSRGGSHDISNIVPACTSCNSRKQAMTGTEFRTRLAREP